MLRLIVVIFVALVSLSRTSNQFDELRGYLTNNSCNVTNAPHEERQKTCNALFSNFKSECLGREYSVRTLNEVPEFRRQITCSSITGTLLDEVMESSGSSKYSESKNILESVRVKEKLKSDMNVKLDELAELQTKELVEKIKLEAEEETAKVERFLAKTEQNYLREILNLIREGLGHDPATHRPTVSPKYTTYQPQLTAKTEGSNGQMLFTNWYTSSPPFGHDGQEIQHEWRCVLPKFWMYELNQLGNIRYREDLPGGWRDHIALVDRQPFILNTKSSKRNYENFEHEFGVRLSQTPLVLGISFLNCRSPGELEPPKEGGVWNWITYHGVYFLDNGSGWIKMVYQYSSSPDPDMVDPLAEDENEPENGEVYLVSAFGSKVKPHDCSNEILGPGIYRMFENRTCKGMPLFSKRAAKVDSRCTDLMLPGVQLEELWAVLSLESWYQECLMNPTSPYPLPETPNPDAPLPVDPRTVDFRPILPKPEDYTGFYIPKLRKPVSVTSNHDDKDPTELPYKYPRFETPVHALPVVEHDSSFPQFNRNFMPVEDSDSDLQFEDPPVLPSFEENVLHEPPRTKTIKV